MTDSALPQFNRVVRRFGDDLVQPAYRTQHRRNLALTAELRSRGMAVREDPARGWEHAHVSLRVKAELAAGARIVDLGGGGSICAYELALSGFDVTVIDSDAEVCAVVNGNAQTLGLGQRLRARHYDGCSTWPAGDGAAQMVVCVSVFEAILRSRRPAFFAECRRVLDVGGQLLLTFDYGEGARLVGDPPCSMADVRSDIVEASGLALVGPLPDPPSFTDGFPPPVRLSLPDVDGFDYVMAAYTFAALRFIKRTPVGPTPSDPPVGASAASAGIGHTCPETLSRQVLARALAEGRLAGLAPAVVRFEAWDEHATKGWYWAISPAGAEQQDRAAGPPACVLSGTGPALCELLSAPDAFWSLHYRGTLAPRGDLACALQVIDRLPRTMVR
jgi:hypothetical protein